MEPIQIIGIKDLDDMETEAVNRLANRYYKKIQRQIKNITSMVVHIKSSNKEGKQRNYSIHVKVIAPTRIFVSTKAMDWNFEKTLHKSFKDVEKRIQHSMHTDKQK
ncbi:hypothetical protein KY347_03590 [Candidatus Woesearchaeota archaeon]|nr:hypothetical protein [Candidatus Woesearchaeota archaeon]